MVPEAILGREFIFHAPSVLPIPGVCLTFKL
jgi:hypothetical protein